MEQDNRSNITDSKSLTFQRAGSEKSKDALPNPEQARKGEARVGGKELSMSEKRFSCPKKPAHEEKPTGIAASSLSSTLPGQLFWGHAADVVWGSSLRHLGFRKELDGGLGFYGWRRAPQDAL